jgi:hypothetical protein
MNRMNPEQFEIVVLEAPDRRFPRKAIPDLGLWCPYPRKPLAPYKGGVQVMKPLLAIYLILLLIFPGCMMIPMALIPAITDVFKTQPESVEKPA